MDVKFIIIQAKSCLKNSQLAQLQLGWNLSKVEVTNFRIYFKASSEIGHFFVKNIDLPF